jgi:hypothetical protein
LTKGKYSMAYENVITPVILFLWEKKTNIMIKMKFTVNMHTQVLNAIISHNKNIFKSILITEHVRFPGKTNNSNFTKVKLHKICQTPIMQTINMWL